jgi:uncharacterized membrane protein YedE/YeeE
MHVAILTLSLGILLGYLAQRSRMCFVGGLRDFILVRDTELLKGMIAFFVTAWLVYSLAGIMGLVNWQPPQFVSLFVGHSPSETGASLIDRTYPISFEKSQELKGNQSAGSNVTLNAQLPYALAIIGGLILGLVSVLANGCPVRQHVLASQGVQDSFFYLLGFYLGIVVFHLVTRPLLALL